MLYGISNALQLTFKGLVEEFVVTWTWETLQYTDSKDLKAAGIEVCNGRKWRTGIELRIPEECLRQKPLIGIVA